MASTVHDLTPCPQCLAPAEIETDLGTHEETLRCDRCGYQQHDHAEGVTTRHGYGTRLEGTPEFGTVQPADEHGLYPRPPAVTCTRVAVRRPPLYRLQFQRGTPTPEDTRPTDWSTFLRWGHLRTALAPLGEDPYALEDHTLYTTSLTGQHGFRTYEARLNGDTLHVGLPGQPAFLLVTSQTAYVALHAGTEVTWG